MTDDAPRPTEHLDLAIGGMTCASCSARIEKKLNRIEGVTATVNLATEKAKVSHTPNVTPDTLITTITKLGYTAERLAQAAPKAAAEIEQGVMSDRQPMRREEDASGCPRRTPQKHHSWNRSSRRRPPRWPRRYPDAAPHPRKQIRRPRPTARHHSANASRSPHSSPPP